LHRTVFEQLLAKCQMLLAGQPETKKKRKFRFKNPRLSLDATVIELCATMFDWAVKEYFGSRKNGFLFETSGGLPMSPRNIMRDSLHPILKGMGRESAGFHTFRRYGSYPCNCMLGARQESDRSCGPAF
jgi:hypothetical protein